MPDTPPAREYSCRRDLPVSGDRAITSLRISSGVREFWHTGAGRVPREGVPISENREKAIRCLQSMNSLLDSVSLPRQLQRFFVQEQSVTVHKKPLLWVSFVIVTS